MPRGRPKNAETVEKAVPFVETKEIQQNIENYPSGEATIEKIKQASQMMNALFASNCMIGDFDSIPQNLRIALLMNLPKTLLKERVIGGTKIKYLPHTVSNKCLNFIFGHRWSYNVVNQDVEEVEMKGKKYYHAFVTVNFEAEMNHKSSMNSYTMKRTISSGTLHPVHVATNKGHAIQSAISKCKTVFLKQMDVGANLETIERESYTKAKEKLIESFSVEDLDTSNFKK